MEDKDILGHILDICKTNLRNRTISGQTLEDPHHQPAPNYYQAVRLLTSHQYFNSSSSQVIFKPLIYGDTISEICELPSSASISCLFCTLHLRSFQPSFLFFVLICAKAQVPATVSSACPSRTIADNNLAITSLVLTTSHFIFPPQEKAFLGTV